MSSYQCHHSTCHCPPPPPSFFFRPQDAYFDFDGDASAIVLPAVKKWPSSYGFTFSTWVRLERIEPVEKGRATPFLYSFKATNGFGYHAFFQGPQLVVESTDSSGRVSSRHESVYSFRAQQWTMVTITHQPHTFKSDMLVVYVNGNPVSTGKYKISSTSNQYTRCCIGASDSLEPATQLQGQLGAFYLFEKVLTKETIRAISLLGPGYVNNFQYPRETSVLLPANDARELYQTGLANTIICNYNPKACDAKTCRESSPHNATCQFFAHSPHATMLPDVQAVTTHPILEALFSSGGVQVLFPLLSQYAKTRSLDEDGAVLLDQQGNSPTQLTGALLSLLLTLLTSSSKVCKQMHEVKGFLLLGFLLEDVSPDQLDRFAVDTLFDMATYLSAHQTEHSTELLKSLYEDVLLRTKLWSRADLKIQIAVYQKVYELSRHPRLSLRDMAGVGRMLHALFTYYKGNDCDDPDAPTSRLRKRKSSVSGVDEAQAAAMAAVAAIAGMDVAGPTTESDVDGDDDMKAAIRSLIVSTCSGMLLEKLPREIRPRELEHVIHYAHKASLLKTGVAPARAYSLWLLEAMGSSKLKLKHAADFTVVLWYLMRLLGSSNDKIRIRGLQVVGIVLVMDMPASIDRWAAFGAVGVLLSHTMTNRREDTDAENGVVFAGHDIAEDKADIQNKTTYQRSSPTFVRKVFAELVRHIGLQTADVPTSQARSTLVQPEALAALFEVLSINLPPDGFDPDHRGKSVLMVQFAEDPDAIELMQSLLDIVESFVTELKRHSATKSGLATLSRQSNRVLGPLLILHGRAVLLSALIPKSRSGSDSSSSSSRAPSRYSSTSSIGDDGGASFGGGGADSGSEATSSSKPKKRPGPPPGGRNLRWKSVASSVHAILLSAVKHQICDVPEGWMTFHWLVGAIKAFFPMGEHNSGVALPLRCSSWEDVMLSFMMPILETFKSVFDSWDASGNPFASRLSKKSTSLPAGSPIIDVNSTVLIRNLASVLTVSMVQTLWMIGASELLVRQVDWLAEQSDSQSTTPQRGIPKTRSTLASGDYSSEPSSPIGPEAPLSPTGVAGPKSPAVTSTPEPPVGRSSPYAGNGDGPVPFASFTYNTSGDEDGAADSDDASNEGAAYERAGNVGESAVTLATQLLRQNVAALAGNTSGEGDPDHKSGSSTPLRSRRLPSIYLNSSSDGRHPETPESAESMGGRSPSPRLSARSEPKDVPEELMWATGDAIELQLKLLDEILAGDHAADFLELGNGKKAMSTGDFIQLTTRLALVSAVLGRVRRYEAKGAGDDDSDSISSRTTTSSGERDSGRGGESDTASISSRKSADSVDSASGWRGHLHSKGILGSAPDPRALHSAHRDADSVLSRVDAKRLLACVERSPPDAKYIITAVCTVVASGVIESYRDMLDHVEDDGAAKVERELRIGVPLLQRLFKIGPEHGVGALRKVFVTKRRQTLLRPEFTFLMPGGAAETFAAHLSSKHWYYALGAHGVPAVSMLSQRVPASVGKQNRELADIQRKSGDVLLARHVAIGHYVREDMPPPCAEVSGDKAPKEILAAESRTHVAAISAWQRVVSVVSNDRGVWSADGSKAADTWETYWRLDETEDKSRRRMRLVRNPQGTSRPEASSRGNEDDSDDSDAADLSDTDGGDAVPKARRRSSGQSWLEASIDAIEVDSDEEGASGGAAHTPARRRSSGTGGAWLENIDALLDSIGGGSEAMDNSLNATAYDPTTSNGSSAPSVASSRMDMNSSGGRDALSNALDDLKAAQHSGAAGNHMGLQQHHPTFSEGHGLDEQASAAIAAVVHGAKLLVSEPCEIITLRECVPAHLYIYRKEIFISVDTTSELYMDSHEHTEIRDWLDTLNARWQTSEVTCIAPRRYILQQTAVEIFFTDRSSMLINLPRVDLQKKVVQSVVPGGASADHLFGFSTPLRSHRSARERFKRADATAQWQAGQLNNFDYLMALNTFAGRSYHDLSEYPVFPWILADYSSEELDLTNPATFRDLSKPVGALNPERLEQLVERWDSWDEADMMAPKCHYGSHYSTPGHVMYWLLRLEPFTEHHLLLQGGKFDHADRLFHSLESTWANCQESSSDVKELIPEMFYLPEMFRNENKFKLGKLQRSGQKVDDVVLPPWAKGSAEVFVQKHREALECPYVTEHLHLWIDLIFGYKQRGPAAVEAQNVFYHICYEGSVDLDTLDDPMMLAAAESQILNFGIVPSRLLRTPHPKKKAAAREKKAPKKFAATHRRRSVDAGTIGASVLDGKPPEEAALEAAVEAFGQARLYDVTPGSAVTFLSIADDVVTSISANQCVWSHKLTQQGMNEDPMLGNASETAKRRLGEPFQQDTDVAAGCFAMLPKSKAIVAGGFWDSSFQSFTVDGRHLDSLFSHVGVLNCVAASRTGCILASGARDATVSVWRYTSKASIEIQPAPSAVLVGHDHPVTCIDIDDASSTVVSGSSDLVLLHKVSGDFVRVVRHPNAKQIRILRLMPDSRNILAYYSDADCPTLALFSPNGVLITSVDAREQPLDIAVSPCGKYVLSGGLGKRAVLRKAVNLLPVVRYSACATPIRAVAFSTREQLVVVGLESGEIGLFDAEVHLQQPAVPVFSEMYGRFARAANMIAGAVGAASAFSAAAKRVGGSGGGSASSA